MPIYNGAAYLPSALASVFEQTYEDFELLALYDSSTDGSLEILRACRDPRLIILENDSKQGVAAILNKGLDLARGEFIARMDSDDFCHPLRFEKQLIFLAGHPEIGICGTWFRGISSQGKLNGHAARLETDPRAVHASSFFRSRIGHPTVMMRTKKLLEYDLRYNPTVFAEDFDFWVRAQQHCDIANIPEFLLFYRMHDGQLSNVRNKSWESTRQIRATLLSSIGLNPDASELDLHQQICTSDFQPSEERLWKADQWLCRLKVANDQARVYQEPFFSKALLERWVAISFHSFRKVGLRHDCYLRPQLAEVTGMGTSHILKALASLTWERTADRVHGWVSAGTLCKTLNGVSSAAMAPSRSLV